MSFLAKLFLDNTERIVHNAHILFRQGVDIIGRPCTYPKGGLINLKVDRTHEGLFFEWAVAPTMMKEGYIRFYKPDGMSKFVDLEFWDCYCVGYNEYFSHKTPENMFVDLVLSPGVLRFRDIVFEKHWKITDLNKSSGNVIHYNALQEDENTPRVIRQYYTDKKNVEKNKLIQGDEIYVVLETRNMTGETIDIDLADKEVDFLYNNKRLKNDILKGYTIGSDFEKIPLDIISEEYEEH